jgi:hypothetical protein
MQQVVFTTRSFDDAPPGSFPVNYPGFTDMVNEGDTIFLGRYLVTGADESSLFLTVRCNPQFRALISDPTRRTSPTLNLKP